MIRRFKHPWIALVVLTAIGATTAVALVRSRRVEQCRQWLTSSVLDAVTDYAARSPIFQVRLRTLQTQIDGLARDGATASAILRELGGRLKDRATQEDLALLKTAIATLDTRASGQAKQLVGNSDGLNGVRLQLEDEVRRVRDEATAARAMIAAVDARLTELRGDIKTLRASVGRVRDDLSSHQRRSVLQAQEQRDDCFARLASVTNDKILRLAVFGFDRLKHHDPAAALDALQAAYAWDPSCPDYLYGIALAQWQRGDVGAARRAVGQAVVAEHRRPTADWFHRVLEGIQGPDREFLEAAKADPTLHHGLAVTPR